MIQSARAQAIVIGVCYVGAFIAADKAALWFEISPGVSLWYAPPGLTLALLLVFGLRWLPLVLATSLASAFLVYPMPHTWATLAMALNVTLGYAATAAAVRAWLGRPPRLDRMSHALGFAFVLLLAGLPLAWIGTRILLAMQLSSPADAGRTVFRWWLGDTAGILSLLPLLLINAPSWLGMEERRARRQFAPREKLEIAAQAAALVGTLALIYFWPPMREHHVPYLSFVPLTWIVLRHGLPGAALGIFGVNVGSVFVLRLTHAPEPILTSFLLFQFAVTAMGLALGAMVTRRQRAEHERNRMVEILEATPDFIGTLAPDGRVLYANTAFRALTAGESTNKARSLGEFVPAWAEERMLREAIPTALQQGRWSGEGAMRSRDGREIPVSQIIVAHQADGGAPTSVFMVARDISEQKLREAQRIESERRMLEGQKLESLGVLAGGIAHDFNNLLTTMLGNANLSRLELAPDSPVQQKLAHVENAALRAAELCQQMLAYSGKGQLQMSLVNLSALVGDTAHLLQVSIPKKTTLEFQLPSNLPPVHADATQLRQICMNLVLNAAEAIADRPGLIRVSTGAMRADEEWLRTSYVMPPPAAGDYVYLEVTDDGRGMSAETKARMFEPFFTTKFTGHGLGLAAVLGIVRGHGGTLRVHSEIDQGTRFRVLFPAARGEAPRGDAPRASAVPWRGQGRILVVDDEENVRVVAARMLEGAGYTVDMAGDGREAVLHFAAQPDAYRAVLLDILMPVLDGEQALEELRRLRSDIPVLLMSGYSGRTGVAHSNDAPTVFLSKPFTRDALLRTLRALLDSAGRTRGEPAPLA